MRLFIATLALIVLATSASVVSAQNTYTVMRVEIHRESNGPTLGIMAVGTSEGLEVTEVFGNTPATRLGLEAGDRIAQVNGQQIRSIADLQYALRAASDNNNGHIRVLVDNIRARQGFYGASRFISRTTFVDGYTQTSSYTPYPQEVYTVPQQAYAAGR